MTGSEEWVSNILGSDRSPDHAVDYFTSYALAMLGAAAMRPAEATERLAEAREALMQIRARKFDDRARFDRPTTTTPERY